MAQSVSRHLITTDIYLFTIFSVKNKKEELSLASWKKEILKIKKIHSISNKLTSCLPLPVTQLLSQWPICPVRPNVYTLTSLSLSLAWPSSFGFFSCFTKGSWSAITTMLNEHFLRPLTGKARKSMSRLTWGKQSSSLSSACSHQNDIISYSDLAELIESFNWLDHNQTDQFWHKQVGCESKSNQCETVEKSVRKKKLTLMTGS